jgi:hypothetical protein
MATRRSGRKTGRNIILFLFLAIVLGCAFAVLYLGTSTGLTFGGSGTRLLGQSGTHPLYAQVGWLRNTAPWPITIDNITTNAQNASAEPDVFLENQQVPPTKQSSKPPVWTLNASKVPYQLNGNALRYLGFSMAPASGQVAAMTRITVEYTGPLGLKFHSTFSGTRVATAADALPDGVLGLDPATNSGSLDAYIAAIRAALAQPDPKTIAMIMGNGATDAQAQAFMTAEKGYANADAIQAFVVTKDYREQRLTFYKGDPVKGALPPIEAVWSDYRWTIRPAGS